MKLKSSSILFVALLWAITLIAWAAVMARIVSEPPALIGSEDAMATGKTPELFDSGVPRDVSGLLAQIYGDASARMKKMVLHPVGRTQTSREFRQARAAQLISQVERERRDLGKNAGLWVGKNVPAAYAEGKRRGDAQAKEAGVIPKDARAGGLQGSFSQVDHRSVIVLAQDTLADLNRAADSMADRAKHVLRVTAQQGLSESQINLVLAGGIIEGAPLQTIRNLKAELEAVHGDKVQITDKNGDPMEFDVGYYAEMVARTKTRQATVVARHQRLEELDIDLVAIVGRISNNFCSAFLGQVFSLSGKSRKYPSYASLPGGGPPFHPNCSKSTRPFIEELATDKQIADAEVLDDAKKLLGQDVSKAQRSFKDLQLHAQVRERYATTEEKLFGGGSKAA